jgi:hypothetical protein
MMRRRLTVLIAVAAAVTVLAGCAPSGGSATPTPTATASPTPTATPTPTLPPSPTPAPAPAPVPANLPTDCSTLASAATRQEAIGDLTLQSDGTGFTRPAPAGATLALGCDWIVGDSTGMLLLISTADASAVTTAADALPAQGYTCQASDDFGATYCVLPGSGPDTEETIVARDDVWIYLSTSNRNGRAFLSEIVQGIFG